MVVWNALYFRLEEHEDSAVVHSNECNTPMLIYLPVCEVCIIYKAAVWSYYQTIVQLCRCLTAS